MDREQLSGAIAGRGGSGLVGGAVERAGTEAFLDKLIPAQLQEAGLLQGAIGMTGEQEAARTIPSTVLQNVGLQREAQEQLGIDEAVARHNFGQTEQAERAMEFLRGLGILGPIAGGTTTSSQEFQSNPFLEIAGTGLTLGRVAGLF